MILPFSTQINGKQTYFVEKIWKGLKTQSPESYIKLWATVSPEETTKKFPVDIDIYNEVKPKLHTIREDKKDRWKPGVMIHFFINARQKNMFRFAPRIPVISTQEIFMTERGGNLEISIAKEGSYIGSDDKYIYWETKEQLAINDGFDSYEAFQRYFIERIYENEKKTGNKWFSGKIIHWTDLKY